MAITMANCSYVSLATHEHGIRCPLCQEIIIPGCLVRQGCSCQLLSCGTCLLTWAEARSQLDLPGHPTCFRCMDPLDVSRLRPGWTFPELELAEESNDSESQGTLEPPNSLSVTPSSEELEEEEFNANRRRGNIITMSLTSERRAALDAQHQRFGGLATQHNTFFLEPEATSADRSWMSGKPRTLAGPSLPKMFMIRGEYQVRGQSFLYFFWVHKDTTIGELGDKWDNAVDGVLRSQASRDMLSNPGGWYLRSRRMDWTDRVGDLGMVDGSSFCMFIPELEVADLSSSWDGSEVSQGMDEGIDEAS